MTPPRDHRQPESDGIDWIVIWIAVAVFAWGLVEYLERSEPVTIVRVRA